VVLLVRRNNVMCTVPRRKKKKEKRLRKENSENNKKLRREEEGCGRKGNGLRNVLALNDVRRSSTPKTSMLETRREERVPPQVGGNWGDVAICLHTPIRGEGKAHPGFRSEN